MSGEFGGKRSRSSRILPIALNRKLMGPDPIANLDVMESKARRSAAWPDIDFDATCWKTGIAKATASRLNHALWFTCLQDQNDADKSADRRDPIPGPFGVFAKALIRLAREKMGSAEANELAHSQSLLEQTLTCLRLLWEVFRARGQEHPAELRGLDFDDAIRLARKQGYEEWSILIYSRRLARIAQILSMYQLTWVPIRFKPRVKSPSERGLTSVEPDASLPSEAAFKALPQIDRLLVDPCDVVRMNAIKISRMALLRIGETVALGVDCERIYVDGRPGSTMDIEAPRGRLVRYSIAYFDEKSKQMQERDIASDAVPAVRHAIAEVRALSATSREVAAYNEMHADRNWLPAPLRHDKSYDLHTVAEELWKSTRELNRWCGKHGVPIQDEYVRREDLEAGLRLEGQHKPNARAYISRAWELLASGCQTFSPDEIATALNHYDVKKWLRLKKIPVQSRSIRRSDLERALILLRPNCASLPQPLSQTLFVFPRHFFKSGQEAVVPVAKPLTTDQIRLFLAGTTNGHVRSVFDRFEFCEPNGDPISVSTHMFRRWLITEAILSDMEAQHVRNWTGHASDAAFSTYVRLTEEQAATKAARSYDLTGTASGLLRPGLSMGPRTVRCQLSRKE